MLLDYFQLNFDLFVVIRVWSVGLNGREDTHSEKRTSSTIPRVSLLMLLIWIILTFQLISNHDTRLERGIVDRQSSLDLHFLFESISGDDRVPTVHLVILIVDWIIVVDFPTEIWRDDTYSEPLG